MESFSVLEPSADGFRNFFASNNARNPAEMLVEKAALLDLSIPEMTVLVGGLRVMNANTNGVEHGVFTDNPGTLSNDFFVNLMEPKIRSAGVAVHLIALLPRSRPT